MNALEPDLNELMARLRADLRIGLAVNCELGAFMALETLPKARFEAAKTIAGAQFILSKRRALDLHLSHDPSRNPSLHVPRDYLFEKARALADPAMDLDYPGKGPLRQGEVPSLWTARILQFCRSARLLPAALFVPEKIGGGSEIPESYWLELSDAVPRLELSSKANLPIEIAGMTQLHVFRALDDDLEHYAIIIGKPDKEAPLVRLHSACFTGDCLGSLKCDCGPQLHRSIEEMHKAGGGILLYLSQEGRGIGLANKIRAYSLQDQGYDTVEANLRLGFDDDERDFRIGAELLKHLKVSRIRLLTNNPRKINWLKEAGIEVVERAEIKISARRENEKYLATKRDKSGHLL